MVAQTTGTANGETIRAWIGKKKAGWYTLFQDSQMPTTSTLLDQAHNAVDRKLFMMKGFHHEEGSQNMFIICLAMLYNMIPYQRRAKNAGKCGIEIQGGVYNRGRHVTGSGYERDCRKYNLAYTSGWTIFLLTGAMAKDSAWLSLIASHISARFLQPA